MTESTYKIYDNWLPEDDFTNLKNSIVFNNKMPIYFVEDVAYPEDHPDYNAEVTNSLDCWYGINTVYSHYESHSNAWPQLRDMFLPAFETIEYPLKALMRIKVNFYPRTHELYEHPKHKDYPFTCYGAVLSLNTCDGFTRLEDGTELDSIENRLVVFSSDKPHNSTTTTNAKGRWNINFNWL